MSTGVTPHFSSSPTEVLSAGAIIGIAVACGILLIACFIVLILVGGEKKETETFELPAHQPE